MAATGIIVLLLLLLGFAAYIEESAGYSTTSRIPDFEESTFRSPTPEDLDSDESAGRSTTPRDPDLEELADRSTTGFPDCCCCSDPCLNDGTCVPTNNGSGYWCDCPPEYTGYQCRIPVVPTDTVGDCEDGPRLEMVQIGSTIVGDCSNTEPYYEAYCQGSCSERRQKCYPIMGGQLTVDMAKQDGTPCSQEVVPMIDECKCSADPLWPLGSPPNPQDCKLVETTYRTGEYVANIDGKGCKNRRRFTLGSCRGGCSGSKKCQGTYENIFVSVICRAPGATKVVFDRTLVSAMDCHCG